MSKAFTREPDPDEDDGDEAAKAPVVPALPAGTRNYITPGGLQRLKDELQYLLHRERPAVTAVVSWAAGNGDRSENADYQYGKRRLREIDRRIRFLGKRIDQAEVIDPELPRGDRAGQVFFGATVRYLRQGNELRTVTIVGIDEINLALGRISWISPLARALLKARAGDRLEFQAPAGREDLTVVEVRYARIETEPFKPVPVSGLREN
ncbi:MAG: transcription elongation factor GreB [Gammaproteobacteria bacterium]|nr:transcription elongation factor GreB [Gammaproteobacteria bacterium]